MKVRIKDNQGYVDAEWTIENGVMIVSPKEVKFEPKDGDICCSLSSIYIYKTTRDNKVIEYHCCLIKDLNILKTKESVGVDYTHRRHRYATEEEKQQLFDRLAEEGLEWNPDTKELVEFKWKPKYGDSVYIATASINSENIFIIGQSMFGKSLENAYEYNRVFKTEQECQAFCDKLNDAINQIKP